MEALRESHTPSTDSGTSTPIWEADLTQGEQTGIFNGSRPVTEAGHAVLIFRKSQECLRTALAHQHGQIPPLMLRADEERATRTEEHEFSPALV
jgi:hypothetical protein